jgi:hypothetical protein
VTDPFIRARAASDEKPRTYPPLPEALVVSVYDNHTHLEMADSDEPLDYREQLDRASSVGVKGVVQVGTDLATSRWSAEVAAIEPRVLAAVALHPNDAPDLARDGLLDDHLAGIDELAARPRVRAVGETGLDFYRTAGQAGIDAQYRSFEAHIEIAKRHGLALQIHDRDAHREVVVTSGEDRVWSSRDCVAADAEPRTLLLVGGQSDVTQLVWPRTRSAQGCPGGLPEPGAGTYSVTVALAGVTSPAAVFGLG